MPITCPNKRLSSWKSLAKIHGEPTAYAIWNEYEGNVPESFYKSSEMGSETTQLNTVIKEGVSELFESNPELANAVYEALGFKVGKKGLIELVHYSRDNKNPLDNFIEDFPLYTSLGDNSEYEDYGKKFNFIIKKETNIKSLIDFHGKYGIDLDQHDMASHGLQPYHFNKREIQAIRKEGVDILIDDWGEYIILNPNSIILKERQKQQAQQLYSSYLQTTNNPTIEGFKQWNNKQQQINELFESNPELANEIYEALGFNFRYTSEKWRDDPTKENKATYINIKGTPSNQEFQVKKDIEEGFYSVHFKTEQGKLTKEQIQILVDAIASQIPIGGKLSTWGEITKGGISGLNRFLNNGFEKVGEREIKDREGNPIIIPILEKVEKSNLERQAQQLYSQYLDTIFPDSKVKDIIYKGTVQNKVFTKIEPTFFTSNPLTASTYVREGLTEDEKWELVISKEELENNRGELSEEEINKVNKRIEYLSNKEKYKGNQIFALINSKNITPFKDASEFTKTGNQIEELNKLYQQGFDTAIIEDSFDTSWGGAVGNKGLNAANFDEFGQYIGTTYVVFEPEQIHILSSKKDIQGFKEFINNSELKTNPTPQKGEYLNRAKSIDLLEADEVKKDLPKEAEETIKTFENRIKVYKKKLSERATNASEIKANISILENRIKALEEKYSGATMIQKMAISDSNKVNESIKKYIGLLEEENLTNNDLLNIFNGLTEISYTLRGWAEIDSLLYKVTEDERMLATVKGVYSNLNLKYRDLVAEALARYARNNNAVQYSSEALKEAQYDVSGGVAKFMSLNETEMPVLLVVDELFKRMANDINQESITKTKEVKYWIDRFAKEGQTQQSVSDALKQIGEDGKWNGNFIGKYQQKFYKEKQALIDEAKELANKGVEKAWSKYFAWMAANTIEIKHSALEFARDMSIEEIEALSDEEFKKKFDVFSKDSILYQKALLDVYKKDRRSFIESLFLEEDYSDGKIEFNENGDYKYTDSGKEINGIRARDLFIKEVEWWENENSPYEYIKAKGASRAGMGGHKYVTYNKPIEKWIDPKFAALSPTMREFYDFMVKRFRDNNKNLPNFNDLSPTYLPELEKSFGQKLMEGGVVGILKTTNNELLTSLTTDATIENDNQIYVGSKSSKPIPVSMMGNKIMPSNKEDNIFVVLNEHTNMAINHKYKKQSEGLALAAQDFLDSVEEYGTADTKEGKTVVKNGKKTKIPGKLITAKKHLEYQINAHIYGITKKDESGLNIKVGEKERKFTMGSVVDWLNSLSYYKSLGIPNVISPLINQIQGLAANMSLANSGIDTNTKEMEKATLLMQSVVFNSEDVGLFKQEGKKIFAFIEKMNLINDLHDTKIKKRSLASWITIFQTKAEYVNQGSLMVAMLKFHKIKDKNGKLVSIYDAYKMDGDNLVWDIAKMGEMKDIPGNRIIGENQDGLNEYAFINYVKEVNHRTHGDYETPMMVKEDWYGRAAMLYKRWIPQGIALRFGKKRFDQHLMGTNGQRGRYVKGRYRTLVAAEMIDGLEMQRKKVIGALLKGMIHKNLAKGELAQLSDVDKANLLAAMREMQFIVTTIVAVAILQGLSDDDDEVNYGLNLAINMLMKSQADMLFFINPNSTKQILNNIAPAVTVFGEILKTANVAIQTLFGDVYYKGGAFEGHMRLPIQFASNFPITSSLIKMQKYSAKTYDYTNY